MMVETAIETKGTNMLNINRIVFVAEPSNVKVGPHKTDSSKLVMKSVHPECAAALCKGLGMEPGNQWRGSNYFITEVDKSQFMAGLAAVSEAMQLENYSKPALPAPQASLTGKCIECGCEGGTHWGFCPNHPENAKKLN